MQFLRQYTERYQPNFLLYFLQRPYLYWKPDCLLSVVTKNGMGDRPIGV